MNELAINLRRKYWSEWPRLTTQQTKPWNRQAKILKTMKICTLQTQLATKTTNPQEPSSLTKSQPTSPAALHTIKTTKTLHDSPTMKTFSTIFFI